MIKISGLSLYTDFTAIIGAYGVRKFTVVYRTDGSTYFVAYASDGRVGVTMALGSGKPATFDADFPQAVQVPTTASVSF